MKKIILVMMVLVWCAVPAFAEETSPHTLGGSITMATDYIYRGISQTSENPAIQGSFDYSHASGLYAGIWASNVDFAGSVEMDWYAGYANEVSGLGYDFMVLFYSYPGADDADAELDFLEFHVGLSYTLSEVPLSPAIGVGYDYSPEFYGEDGTGQHYSASLDLSLPGDIGLGGTYGYQDVEGDVTSPDGFDYAYWRIGVSKEIMGFGLDLSYWDTNEEEMLGEDIAGDRIVFSVSKGF